MRILGAHFDKKKSNLYIYMPLMQSLSAYLLSSEVRHSSEEKHKIIQGVTNALIKISGSAESTLGIRAHGHLHPGNVFLDESGGIVIGDYGLESLKKMCRIFNGYSTLSNYSPPELWEKE